MRRTQEAPLASNFFLSAKEELSKATDMFDLSEDRFNYLLA